MSAASRAGGPRAGGSRLRASHAVFAATFAVYLSIAVADGGQSAGSAAALAVAAWAAIGTAVVVGLELRPATPQARLALGSLALLTLLVGLSALWAGDDGRVFVELARSLAYLGSLLLLLAALRSGEGRALLAGLAAALVAVALLALGARFFPEALTGDRSFLANFPDALRGRLSYPIGYWNGLAATMAGAIVLLAWFGSAATTPRARALAVAMLPPVTLTLYLTGSRGGLLAAVLGVVVFSALTPVRARALGGIGIGVGVGILVSAAAVPDQDLVEGVAGRSPEWLLFGLTLAAVAVAYRARLALDDPLRLPELPRLLDRRPIAVAAVLGAVAFFALGGADDRLAEFQHENVADTGRGELTGRFLSTGGNGRYQLWGTALEAAADEPLHGIGAGAYGYYWNQNGSTPDPVRDAHSLFLEALAELGPLGLLAVCGVFAAGAWGTARRTFGDLDGMIAAAAGLLVAATVGVAIDWTWEIPAATALTLVAMAMLGAGGAGAAAARPSGPTRALVLVLSLAAVAFAGSIFLSEQALDRSREQAAAGDLAAAASSARDAARLQPAAAGPWVQLGLVQGLARDVEGSVESLEEAVERAPENPSVRILLSIAYFSAGDPRGVEEHGRALELLPAER